MRKKVKAIVIGSLICLLIACSGETTDIPEATAAETTELTMEYIGKSNNIEEYRDAETGVHYFVYSDWHGYGAAGGLCPRYNADGTLYVD